MATTLERLQAEQARRNDTLTAMRAEIARRNAESPVTQFGAGTKEGVAGFLGAPVDMLTGAINARIGQVNQRFPGDDVAPIADPVGGSQSVMSLFEALGIKDVPTSDSTAGRYARRAGQEVGFGAPAALTGMSFAGPLTKAQQASTMGVNTAGDLSAALAGQTVQEIGDGGTATNVIDGIVSVLAGASPAMATSRPRKPPAPYTGTQEMFDAGLAQKNRALNSGVSLTPQAELDYFRRLDDTMKAEGATPVRHPRAFDVVDQATKRPAQTLRSIDDTRYQIGRDVAGSRDEAGLGVSLKQATDDYLNNLERRDVMGGLDPEQAVRDLQEGRRTLHQANKAATVEGKQYRGQTRAATSGTGGNEVNAQRQNIRAILDNEVAPTRAGRRSGYTPDEIAQMERIVMGTPGQNTARWLGRSLSPSTGALQGLMGGGFVTGGGVATAMTGNPLYMMSAVPPAIGLMAKGAAERATKREIEGLLDIIRRGGVSGKAQLSNAARSRLLAAILSASDAVASEQ